MKRIVLEVFGYTRFIDDLNLSFWLSLVDMCVEHFVKERKDLNLEVVSNYE